MRKITIGRDVQNDIVYKSPEVSSDHAELVEKDGQYTLVDHSKNGTFINGRRIHYSSCSVREGDSIVFGGVEDLNWRKVSRLLNKTIPINVVPRDPTIPYGGNNLGGNIPVGGYGGKTTAPYAVASMVCGILSLVLPSWLFGLLLGFLIDLALAIVGLSLGINGTRQVRGHEELYSGIGMLKAGKICSIVTLSLIGLGIISIPFLVAWGISLFAGLL